MSASDIYFKFTLDVFLTQRVSVFEFNSLHQISTWCHTSNVDHTLLFTGGGCTRRRENAQRQCRSSCPGVFVCACLCVSVCERAYARGCVCVFYCVWVFECTCKHIYNMIINTCALHACIHTYKYTHIYIIYEYTYMCTAHMQTYIHTNVYVSMYVKYIY